MKTVVIIFSVYLVSLAFAPCTDCLSVHQANPSEITVHSEGDDTHNRTETEDGCSAFCLCQCCNTPATEVEPLNGSIVIPHFGAANPSLVFFIPDGIVGGIFLPPRI